MLETYGFRETLGQGYEKLVIDPIRYRKVRTTEPVARQLPSTQPTRPATENHSFSGTVCYFVHAYFPDSSGGTERFVYNQAQYLLKRGGKAFVFVYSAEPRSQYPHMTGDILYREDEHQGVPVIRFRLAKAFYGGTKSIYAGDTAGWEPFFLWMVRRCAPRIVHFAGLNRTNRMAILCQKYKMPYLVTATDFFPVCHYSTLIDRDGMICSGSNGGTRCSIHCACSRAGDMTERHRTAQRILAEAEAVCVPSSYVAQIFEREFSGLTFAVIPHGLDGPRRAPKRWGPVRRYMYAGSISEAKGVFLLASAFFGMPQECTLSIFGSGNRIAVSRLKRLVRQNGRVKYHGLATAAQLRTAYENSDCVVVPSSVPETYNFVAHEALQSGCIVVARNMGIFPEMIQSGKNGFLYSDGGKAALAEALRAAIQFSWRDYRQTHFLSTEEESLSYHNLYCRYSVAHGRKFTL